MRAVAESVPVRLRGVTKRFGSVVAVDSVDLDVPPGKLVTLLGPSGCGKTTTLRIVAGLERPTAGRVWIGEEDVTDLPAARRGVTMVFQSYALFPHLTVFENVAYGLRAQRLPAAEVRRRTLEALELVGLPETAQRYPAQLSGGQQQRVALARALVMQPRVLLFDEPLSNLDAKLRRRVRAEIRMLQQRLGITSVYVTHDQAEALALSDVVVVMNQGRVEQVGSPEEVYRRPRTRFVADFIGEANLLPATYRDGAVEVAGYRFPLEQEQVREGPVTLMVRPEAVVVVRDGAGLPGLVRTVFFMGMTTEILVDTPAGEVLATQPYRADRNLAPGQEVRLRFEEAGVYLLPAGAQEGRG
ncbi:MAG: ABC transporter ATP-binding protein [Armatimonadota bacterium]|nr:ABC transporter ATP-binding protein [Armatimonadota bacterium]MDR5675582.1 ABC transporter ATP-binding protein [Armatimonadota bacterium]MDR5690345.1 ABC transporter ATP-binding protein [Armatimonadota bacterium]MDR7388086.1 ABC transporter ATP-binding protein [Armatimonadota bacterium]MDR7392781.1 ABC transporter ATP-binding protein [Armatimonadota bacterium]